MVIVFIWSAISARKVAISARRVARYPRRKAAISRRKAAISAGVGGGFVSFIKARYYTGFAVWINKVKGWQGVIFFESSTENGKPFAGWPFLPVDKSKTRKPARCVVLPRGGCRCRAGVSITGGAVSLVVGKNAVKGLHSGG